MIRFRKTLGDAVTWANRHQRPVIYFFLPSFFFTPRDNTRRYVLLYRHIASIYTKHGRAIKDIKEKQEIVGNAKQR